MRTAAIGVMVVLGLALGGCASSKGAERRAATESWATAEVAATSAELQRYRIRNWSAPNDHTVIIEATDGTRYRAETMGPCIGLDFANRLAFVNRGGFERVDRFSSVALGDGTRCAFQSFDKLKTPETKALDSYEKSKEANTKKEAESPK